MREPARDRLVASLSFPMATTAWLSSEPSPSGSSTAAEGDDLGLPFDPPYLDLYDRCSEARRAVDPFLRRPPEDQRVHRALRRVCDCLDPIVCEVPFAPVAHARRWRARACSTSYATHSAWFPRPQAATRQPAPARTTPPEQAQAALRDIRKAVETTPALFGSTTSSETASLPKRDRTLVRFDCVPQGGMGRTSGTSTRWRHREEKLPLGERKQIVALRTAPRQRTWRKTQRWQKPEGPSEWLATEQAEKSAADRIGICLARIP